jgi:presenilin-like A22 family membrane protease
VSESNFDGDLSERVPTLLEGTSARRQLFRFLTVSLILALTAFVLIVVSSDEKWVTPSVYGTCAAAIVVAIWRGTVAIRTIARESRAHYTTLGGSLWDNRYWLLDDTSGAVIRRPSRTRR